MTWVIFSNLGVLAVPDLTSFLCRVRLSQFRVPMVRWSRFYGKEKQFALLTHNSFGSPYRWSLSYTGPLNNFCRPRFAAPLSSTTQAEFTPTNFSMTNEGFKLRKQQLKLMITSHLQDPLSMAGLTKFLVVSTCVDIRVQLQTLPSQIDFY